MLRLSINKNIISALTSVGKTFDIYAKRILHQLCRLHIVAHKYTDHFRVSAANENLNSLKFYRFQSTDENSFPREFYFIAAKQSDICRSRYSL